MRCARANGAVAVASEQVVHPCTAALGFARVPVGIEGAELLAAFGVEEIVEFHFRVPGLDGVERSVIRGAGCGVRDLGARISYPVSRISFFNAQSEDLLRDFVHAADDTVDRKVGAQGFFVEGVVGLALFFGPIADLPRL